MVDKTTDVIIEVLVWPNPIHRMIPFNIVQIPSESSIAPSFPIKILVTNANFYVLYFW